MRIIEKYASEVIAIETAIAHLRVGDVDQETKALIGIKLASAVEIAEGFTNRAIAKALAEFSIPKTSRVFLNSATVVQRIEYIDTSGSRVELASDNYRSYVSAMGVELQFTKWPSDITADNLLEKCWVIADVGFEQTTVPRGIVAAVLLLLGTLYDNESDEIVGRSVSKLSLTAEKILSQYRIAP